MIFDPENEVVKRCAQGMNLEAEGKNEEARQLFESAWEMAETDLEKFTAAHYLARHQPGPQGKLKWDLLALFHAQQTKEETAKGAYPSLYLNIGKCHEDLGDLIKARENYQLAEQYSQLLNDDGYGRMIRSGIRSGLERVAKS